MRFRPRGLWTGTMRPVTIKFVKQQPCAQCAPARALLGDVPFQGATKPMAKRSPSEHPGDGSDPSGAMESRGTESSIVRCDVLAVMNQQMVSEDQPMVGLCQHMYISYVMC